MSDDTFNPWVPEMERRMESITSALALRAAHYLARIRRYSDATVKVSQARIAAALNATTEGVRKALCILRDAGLISWTGKHRHASTYSLLYLRPADDHARRRRDEPDAVNPTGVGSIDPTGVGTISQKVLSFQRSTPPTPRSEPASADSVPDVREGISSQITDGAADAATAESAGWSERLDAERAAEAACPSGPSMTRAQADRLVAAAACPGAGQAIIAPERLSKPSDADALPLTPEGAERVLLALAGADFGAHGAYAASRVRQLAAGGDLTARMIDQSITDASDARGLGATRFVAAVCRRLHAARLCARRTDMLNARRVARRIEDGDPAPAPRSAWLAPIIAAGGVLGEAENSDGYAALTRRVACPA